MNEAKKYVVGALGAGQPMEESGALAKLQARMRGKAARSLGIWPCAALLPAAPSGLPPQFPRVTDFEPILELPCDRGARGSACS